MSSISDENIDPALRATDSPIISSRPNTSPAILPDGNLVSKADFETHLQTLKHEGTLRAACEELNIPFAKKTTLPGFREKLVNHWYQPPTRSGLSLRTPSQAHRGPSRSSNVIPSKPNPPVCQVEIDAADSTAQDMLQDSDSEDEEDIEDEGEGDESWDLGDDDDFSRFQTTTRITAAKHSEGNRRPGGMKTQASTVKIWNLFLFETRLKLEIRDDIVDEHSLILFINWCGERPQLNRKFEYIPDTRIGAISLCCGFCFSSMLTESQSQIKKGFYGALRICKQQDAANPRLAITRPAATVYVWDLVKTRMREAIVRHRQGLIPGQDAPDIVANTFLDQTSEEQLKQIGYAFLSHRELQPTIMGHVAWTCQNASGNRGDDLRALKQCDLQPYKILHPNMETIIPTILGLQDEHKAIKNGMQTTVNPTYTAFIAHRNPVMCPMGAIAIYLHWLHDCYKLAERVDIDWAQNSSWRKVRFVFGASPTKLYTDSSLYNLYGHAYKLAGFESAMKAHYARHMLGYRQARLGVDAGQTSKLGWSKDTFADTYAPQLPKTAILGAHDYKVSEAYDNVWTHVRVPESFLDLVYPQAEGIVAEIEGRKNLIGATKYWLMAVDLRTYLFQAAAAIFQVLPGSPIFQLPALAHSDVQTWMRTVYPSELACLQASAGSPVDLMRIQNEAMCQALEENRVQLRELRRELSAMRVSFDRWTAVLSPAKAYSHQMYTSSASRASGDWDPFIIQSSSLLTTSSAAAVPTTPPRVKHDPPSVIDDTTRALEDTGVYETEEHALRGFVCPSPVSHTSPRPRTQIDLCLPPVQAFHKPGEPNMCWPPILGQGSLQWPAVFSVIHQPALLWNCWKPLKTLDQMTVCEVWQCYNHGEPVFDINGNQTGVKPPLRLVEQHWKAEWRGGPTNRQAWWRLKELPDWIDAQVNERGLTAAAAITELDAMKTTASPGSKPLGTNALKNLIKKLRVDAAKAAALTSASSASLGGAISQRNSSVLPPTPSPSLSPMASAVELPTVSPGKTAKKRRGATYGGRAKVKKPRN